jgi:hypothetical protein
MQGYLGADDFKVKLAKFADLGFIRGRVNVSDLGTEGNDHLAVDGTTRQDLLELTANRLSQLDSASVEVNRVSFDGLETMTVHTGDGVDVVSVTGAHTPVTLNTGAGDDHVLVSAPVGTTLDLRDLLRAGVTVNSGEGSDRLWISNAASSTPHTATVTPTQVGGSPGDDLLRPGVAINYNGTLENLELHMSQNPSRGDRIMVTPSETTSYLVHGLAPVPVPPPPAGDVLVMNLTGTIGARHTPGPEIGSGLWTFANRRPVVYRSIEQMLKAVPVNVPVLSLLVPGDVPIGKAQAPIALPIDSYAPPRGRFAGRFAPWIGRRAEQRRRPGFTWRDAEQQ